MSSLIASLPAWFSLVHCFEDEKRVADISFLLWARLNRELYCQSVAVWLTRDYHLSRETREDPEKFFRVTFHERHETCLSVQQVEKNSEFKLPLISF